MMNESMARAVEGAESVWRYVLRTRPDERATVVTDDGAVEIGRAFYDGARRVTDRVAHVVVPPISEASGEPIEAVEKVLGTCDVYVGISSAGAKSLTHTRARRAASEAGARGLTLPGVTIAVLMRDAARADYAAIAAGTEQLARRLTGSSEIRVTSDAGTDLRFDVHGGEWFAERGLCDRPGQFSNLPGGEVSIAPVDVDGTWVVDGSISWLGRLESPLTIEIRHRRIVAISGARAEEFRAYLDRFGPPAYNIAEIGIGMNPAAKLCGNVLEDEKILGSIHVGFGDNSNMGGKSLASVVQAPIHGDGVVISAPVILADGEAVDPRMFMGI